MASGTMSQTVGHCRLITSCILPVPDPQRSSIALSCMRQPRSCAAYDNTSESSSHAAVHFYDRMTCILLCVRRFETGCSPSVMHITQRGMGPRNTTFPGIILATRRAAYQKWGRFRCGACAVQQASALLRQQTGRQVPPDETSSGVHVSHDIYGLALFLLLFFHVHSGGL